MCSRGRPIAAIIAFIFIRIDERGDVLLPHVSPTLDASDDSFFFVVQAGCNSGCFPVDLYQLLHSGSSLSVPFCPGSSPRSCHVNLLLEVLVWHVKDADGLFLNLPNLEVLVHREAVPDNGLDDEVNGPSRLNLMIPIRHMLFRRRVRLGTG